MTLSMSLLRMQLQFIQVTSKKNICSDNLLTSLTNPFQFAVLLRCVVLANYGRVQSSLISAALLQAVLQANTERSRTHWSK